MSDYNPTFDILIYGTVTPSFDISVTGDTGSGDTGSGEYNSVDIDIQGYVTPSFDIDINAGGVSEAGTYVISCWKSAHGNNAETSDSSFYFKYDAMEYGASLFATSFAKPTDLADSHWKGYRNPNSDYLYSVTDIMSDSLVVPIQAVTGVVLLRYDGLVIVYSDWQVASTYDFDYVAQSTSTKFKIGIPIEYDVLTKWDEFDPINTISTTFFEKNFDSTDIVQTVSWGYGLNNFLVGGTTTVPSTPEPGVIDPPGGEVIEHINYEVYHVVNIVNITETVSSTPIMFDNFSIQTDIESYAWTVNFDVLDKASFDLIRPMGKTLKTIDIAINNETFTLVVSKGSIQRRQGRVVYRCSGWSRTKLLADPYASKRSFTDTSQRTAAQIVDNELTGTGFTYTWSTVDWTIPAGIHSYQDKTPLGAIIAVCEAVGAVIVPHQSNLSFDVRPYYPNSPWQWDSAGLQRSMNELAFFEISNEPVPMPNPDGVYVYGEDSNGVGVKAVRNGKPGTALLPDVVNKYITANIAGQERGRVEVSKNCFIDRYTMSTYVDTNGIIKPFDLIEFTDTEGGTWRGMVMGVKVDCARVGTALTQTITVGRFYDD